MSGGDIAPGKRIYLMYTAQGSRLGQFDTGAAAIETARNEVLRTGEEILVYELRPMWRVHRDPASGGPLPDRVAADLIRAKGH